MKVTDAQAESGRRLEAAARCVHANGGGSEGVFRWEDERSPILTTLVRCFGGSGKDIMPFQYIAFRWMRDNVRWRILRYDLVFARESLIRRFVGHDDCERSETSVNDGGKIQMTKALSLKQC